MAFVRPRKTLREVLSSLKSHKKHTRNIALFLSCFTDQEIVQLISVSKELSATMIAFPVNYLRFFMAENSQLLSETNLLFHCVRDYLILKRMQHDVAHDEKVTIDAPIDMLAKLTSVKVAHDSKAVLAAADSHVTWNKMMTAIRRQTATDSKKAHEKIRDRLKELKVDDVDHQVNKVLDLAAHHTSVVVTFPSNKFSSLLSDRFVNYFSVKSRVTKTDTFGTDAYFWSRLATEVMHFKTAPPETLMTLSLDATAHPCYATLQFNSSIHLLSNYGDSFVVFQPSIKKLSCASMDTGYGNPKMKYYAIDGAQSVAPLVASFPDAAFKTCVSGDEKTDAVRRVPLTTNDIFLEVLFPANLSLADPAYIKHIHLGFNPAISLRDIDQLMKTGILVSVGKSPFENADFSNAFQTNQLEKFLTQQVLKQIELAVLHIGETTSDYVQMKFDYRTLQLMMKIHLNNSHFHQAQAAAILYLFGVEEYFKTTPAMTFYRGQKNPEFCYTMTLNGMVRKEGKLTDQDGYTCEYSSMRLLLNHLLKRVFSIALVSRQNADYLEIFNRTHPKTGQGATEESHQTKPLHLGDEKQSYDLRVGWFFDTTVIEVVSDNAAHIDFVYDTLTKLTLEPSREKNFLCITLPLATVFARLHQHKFHYQATIVYEDCAEFSGDMWLAFRNGYTVQGGHCSDPYNRWIDNEFGAWIADASVINGAKRIVGTIDHPKTICVSVPARCYQRMRADPGEFAADSLDHFAVYALGDLHPHQLRNAARMMGMSQEAYIKYFDRALALRPLPAIDIYLQDCEKVLVDLLQNLIGEKHHLKLFIHREKTTVQHDRRQYWKPEKDFGRVEVAAAQEIIDRIINYFKVIYPQKFIIEKCSPTCIRFININPQELIKIFQAAPPKLAAFDDETFVQLTNTHLKDKQLNKTVLTESTDLNGHITAKKAEIILGAARHGIKLDSFLGTDGVKYFNEFVVALSDEKQAEQRVLIQKAISAMCAEARNWFDDSLLYSALINRLLPAIKFLIENKHCDPGKISEEWSARLFVTCTYIRGVAQEDEIRDYICKVCPPNPREWFLRYVFFKDSRGEIRGHPKVMHTSDGAIYDIDPAEEMKPGYSAAPDSEVEEMLKLYEKPVSRYGLMFQPYNVVFVGEQGQSKTGRACAAVFVDMSHFRNR